MWLEVDSISTIGQDFSHHNGSCFFLPKGPVIVLPGSPVHLRASEDLISPSSPLAERDEEIRVLGLSRCLYTKTKGLALPGLTKQTSTVMVTRSNKEMVQRLYRNHVHLANDGFAKKGSLPSLAGLRIVYMPNGRVQSRKKRS